MLTQKISEKQSTDWNSVLEDLFGIDPIQTVESAHDSSSGFASDAASGYPSTGMTTFKGGSDSSHDTRRLKDKKEKNCRWASTPSPCPNVHYDIKAHHRMSPASPLMYNSRSHCQSPVVEAYNKERHIEPYNMGPHIEHMYTHLKQLDLQDTDKLFLNSGKGKYRHARYSPFDLLTDDAIVNIFSNLPSDQLCRCSRVCQRWYRLVWDPLLWKRIVISSESINIDKALKYLTRKLSYNTPTVCVIVEKIIVNGCEKLTNTGLHTIAKRCPELRHLEVQGCANITNSALFEVVSYCVNLEYLDVTGCPCITCISLTEAVLRQASAHHLRQVYIRYLDMTDCYALEDDGLKTIANHCSQLQYLYLRRCVRIGDNGIQGIANSCYCLKELSISDCRKITDFGICELSKLEGNLRYLSVAKCDKVSDVGIIHIAKYCRKLRYLNVRGCEAVSDDALDCISRHCTRLKSLDLGKCDITDEGLQCLAQNSSQLRKLSLKSCDAITDKGVMLVAYQCRNLQQLNIQDCHLTVDAYRAVKKFCKRCIIEHTNPGFY